jgi:shikimate kinase
MERINRSGKSIFLDVPVRQIAKRMEQISLTERPLLGALPLEEVQDKIARLRSERIGFYRQATIILSGEAITAGEVIKKINL